MAARSDAQGVQLAHLNSKPEARSEARVATMCCKICHAFCEIAFQSSWEELALVQKALAEPPSLLSRYRRFGHEEEQLSGLAAT